MCPIVLWIYTSRLFGQVTRGEKEKNPRQIIQISFCDPV